MTALPPELIPNNEISVNELLLEKIDKLSKKKNLEKAEEFLLLRIILYYNAKNNDREQFLAKRPLSLERLSAFF